MLTVSWLLTDLTPSTLWANSVALFLAIILGAVPFNKTLPLVTSTLIFKALSSESAAKEELIAIFIRKQSEKPLPSGRGYSYIVFYR